ncbi:MAG: GTP 3',8-cyclase MoaA [Alphaproteobacteria bacterium]
MNLKDTFERRFPYLRLSITDVCNFRCLYCLPNGYKKTGNLEFLCIEEVIRLVRAFASLGVVKVRLTGGEPTIRKDLIDIVREIRKNTTIQKVAITTNGYRLKTDVEEFYNAGVTSLNVSIDSLNPIKFHEITGHNQLDSILAGLEKALKQGFDSIKINTVLLKQLNQDDIVLFFEWIKTVPYQVRFIELMETGLHKDFFKKNHLSADKIVTYLGDLEFIEKPREFSDGPARIFTHKNYQGSIGIIAPYAKDFCKTCNRLRITAKGHLRLCLFGDSSHDLRPYLQNDQDQQLLESTILDLLVLKKPMHNLHNNDVGLMSHLASLGG